MGLRRSVLVISTAGLATLGLVGCGSSSPSGSAPSGGDPTKTQVMASFYPLQWVAEQVGGDAVEVSNLTATGAEPHDLELTPRDVAAISDADLVFFLSGFQPAVDDAVEGSRAPSLDAADAADLSLVIEDDDHDHEDDDHEDEDDDHAEDADDADDDHEDGDGATDPHFWLDPTRLADVGDALAAELATVDPGEADAFQANAAALRTELASLDAELEEGLSDCRSTKVVTSHTAFGYLAQRYDLTQVGISGLSPNDEPSPADLAEVTEFVKDNEVQTIYFETLVDPSVAETIASETGASTAVLDPIEGLSEASDGDDYLAIMRSNLASLQAGQPCG